MGSAYRLYLQQDYMSYRHPQAYKALHTKGITTIALPYIDYIVWGQCGETLKDRLQTLENKTA